MTAKITHRPLITKPGDRAARTHESGEYTLTREEWYRDRDVADRNPPLPRPFRDARPAQ
jgi:hypothetical protein